MPLSHPSLYPCTQASRSVTVRKALTASALAFAAATTLAGCSSLITTAANPAASGQAISGSVHGGQQPVVGAHIFLYAAGNSGYSSASTSMLTTGLPGVSTDPYGHGYVTSDNNGNFAITGDYTCPTGTGVTETYLYATGGNPGLAAGTNNTAIALIAALGPCGNLNAGTQVDINEVSTVAAITALHQFMKDGVDIGAPAGNMAGLTNAFSSITNIVDTPSGTARATNLLGNGSVPASTINTLADILAPCVNSVGPSSNACSNLFSTVKAPGNAPTTVAAAMLDIALAPSCNTAALLAQVDSAAPFAPKLATAPASYTVGVTYTGYGLSAPGDISIDASGNAWVVNCPTCPTAISPGGTGTDSIIGIGAQGALLSGPNGFSNNIHQPQGVSIDLVGNIWSSNDASGQNPDNIMVMTPAGGSVGGFPYSSASLSTPEQIVIDPAGNAWVSNFSSSTALKISSGGAVLAGPVTSPGFANAAGLVMDNSQNLYMAGNGSSSILSFDDTGAILSGSGKGYTQGGILMPLGIAVDSGPHVWDVNNNNSVSEIFGHGGAGVSPQGGFVNLGLAQAATLTIDGAGTVWIPNCRKSCPGSGDSTNPDNIVHLATNGTVLSNDSNIQDPGFNGVGIAAIDASGNLWITDNASAAVTELLGVAVPVNTPTALQVKNATVGMPAQ